MERLWFVGMISGVIVLTPPPVGGGEWGGLRLSKWFQDRMGGCPILALLPASTVKAMGLRLSFYWGLWMAGGKDHHPDLLAIIN